MVFAPSPTEWPQTQRNVTGITNNHQARITSPAHGFSSDDEHVAYIDFKQVGGMLQINGLPGQVQSVIDANNFTVNIDTTGFYPFTSGGNFNILTGIPAKMTAGQQIFNKPFQNVFGTQG